MASLSENKFGRISFEAFSANGVILFKEISQLIEFYSNNFSLIKVLKDVYLEKVKPVILISKILTNCLVGDYICFGVLRLANDNSLDKCLTYCLSLICSLPKNELFAHNKTNHFMFSFFSACAKYNCISIFSLEHQLYLYLLELLKDGLNHYDNVIVKTASTAIEFLLMSHFHCLMQFNEKRRILVSSFPILPFMEVTAIAEQAEKHRSLTKLIYQPIFNAILEGVFGSDTQNIWSLSRSFFLLVLLEPQLFEEAKFKLISSQDSPENKQMMQMN